MSAFNQWELFAATVEQLAGSRSQQEIVEVLRSAARKLAGADGIAIILRDGDQCHYIAEDAHSPLWQGQRFPMADCVSGWSMLRRQTAIIPDISRDDRVPQEAYADTFVKSMVMVPIGRPEPVAALGAYWRVAGVPDEDTLATIEGLARAASTGLENIRLIDSLKAAREREELLTGELAHRLRNMFAVVRALAARSLRDAESVADAQDKLMGRLDALAEVHRQLLTLGEEADLAALIRATLAPLAFSEDQVSLAGPPVQLSRGSAVSFVLGVHELATNAVKYGALSVAEGKVRVEWTLDRNGADHLELVWLESGGPHVAKPDRMGFGSKLIQQSFAHERDATTDVQFLPDGVIATLRARIVPARADSGNA